MTLSVSLLLHLSLTLSISLLLSFFYLLSFFFSFFFSFYFCLPPNIHRIVKSIRPTLPKSHKRMNFESLVQTPDTLKSVYLSHKPFTAERRQLREGAYLTSDFKRESTPIYQEPHTSNQTHHHKQLIVPNKFQESWLLNNQV